MTVKNRTGHAKTAAFPILRRRGRCLHRPARNGRFMAVFRRNRVDFLFYAVGADDPVRPQETSFFTENRCEIATFSMGRCRHRPLQTATKIQRILKGGQSRPPLQCRRNLHACARRLQIRQISCAPTDPRGKIQERGPQPPLGRFKGIAKGEIEIPLCHSFFQPSTALSFSCEKESGVETSLHRTLPEKTRRLRGRKV